MALTANNDLVTLSANFESLKAKVEAIEIIVYGENILEFNLVGTNIVFSSAPTAGHSFFGIIYADIPQTFTVITDVVWPSQPSTSGPNS